MASFADPTESGRCPLCRTMLYEEPAIYDSPKLFLDQLPPARRPWVMVKFEDTIIFANEDWPPHILLEIDEGCAVMPLLEHQARLDSTMLMIRDPSPKSR